MIHQKWVYERDGLVQMKLHFNTPVRSSLEQVKAGFDRELFLKLKPPFLHLQVDRFDGCVSGCEVHLRTGLPGLLQSWVSVITEDHLFEGRWIFVDEGKTLPFPLRFWRHHHEVRSTPSGGSEILDQITYSTGNVLMDALIYVPLWWTFSVRDPVYRQAFGDLNLDLRP